MEMDLSEDPIPGFLKGYIQLSKRLYPWLEVFIIYLIFQQEQPHAVLPFLFRTLMEYSRLHSFPLPQTTLQLYLFLGVPSFPENPVSENTEPMLWYLDFC